MADWKLVTGQVSGKCPHCGEHLRYPDTVLEWRGGRYHEGCLLDLLTSIAPPGYYHYPPPTRDAP